MFDQLIKDTYRIREDYGTLSGIVYGAISTIGFSQIDDIEDLQTAALDMLHVSVPDDEFDIYRSDLQNYVVKRRERRIYLLLRNKPQQIITF